MKNLMKPKIAFVGMTHLGLISAVAASEKGFDVLCFDPDLNLIDRLKKTNPLVSEPQLVELMHKNQNRLMFTSDSNMLRAYDVIYVAPDVTTDDQGQSDLSDLNNLLNTVFSNSSEENLIVILSQVPPGFSRSKVIDNRSIFYQVETLIFGQAINRALHPERYIIGSLNPTAELPIPYRFFLESHDCPILVMRYESAELAKISINMCLVSSVTTANTLAELCEQIGADWSEIVPALKLDRRIGQYAYLSPGLGISGGNLERDLATVVQYASQFNTDSGVVRAWISNSFHRKNWIWSVLNNLESKNSRQIQSIGVLGLTYKENTNSLKNSPALVFLALLEGRNKVILAYDPVASPNAAPTYVTRVQSAQEVLVDIDVLVISTAWPEFRSISTPTLIQNMKGRIVIDPYGMLDGAQLKTNGFTYYKLGESL
jgi:UDPglucose 6-dehydrogenase